MTTQLLLCLQHSGRLNTPEINELLNNLDHAIHAQTDAGRLMPAGTSLHDFTFTQVPALDQYHLNLPITAVAIDQFIRLLGHQPDYIEGSTIDDDLSIMIQGTLVGVCFEPLRAHVIYGGQASFERHPTSSLQVLTRTLIKALTQGVLEEPELTNALAGWWLEQLVRSRNPPMPRILLSLALGLHLSGQNQRTPGQPDQGHLEAKGGGT